MSRSKRGRKLRMCGKPCSHCYPEIAESEQNRIDRHKPVPKNVGDEGWHPRDRHQPARHDEGAE